jgi:hypothetical protein
VAQRQVLYLGEINASQREAWRKTIEVQDEGRRLCSAIMSFEPSRSLTAARSKGLSSAIERSHRP